MSCCPVQIFDPHKAAVHEVQRVLQHPEDLKRLPAFLENKTREQQVPFTVMHDLRVSSWRKRVVNKWCMVQANKAQLTATVASQVDEARAGIAALDEAQLHLITMQNCYRASGMPAVQSTQLAVKPPFEPDQQDPTRACAAGHQ